MVRSRILVTILSCLLFLAVLANAKSQADTSVLELKSNWRLSTGQPLVDAQPPTENGFWIPAIVPGTIITSLQANKVYPDPLFGTNILKIPENLNQHCYWYKNVFTVPRSWNSKFIRLEFEGINYRAEIWLNKKHIGSMVGAFVHHDFDVTGVLNHSRSNTLEVQIFPQPHPGEPHYKSILTGTGRNGGITAVDGPTFFCSIGWDWIPTIPDRDTGIWLPVQLRASGPLTISEPYITSNVKLIPSVSSIETITATIRNESGITQSGSLVGIIGTHNFKSTFQVAPYSHLLVNLPLVSLKNPKLWWPNGYGSPNLTELKLICTSVTGFSDSKTIAFGIRKIEYQVPGSDNLTLVVNGVPIVAKGGDWGMEDALKQISAKRMDAMIRMHAEANYTIIRNWCGQSTSPLFYDMCDKYGILVWDEFFQPNPSDGPNPTDVTTYLANVKDKILRYRNHPCIVLWCARNEGNPPPEINAGLSQLIQAYDPVRLYQPSSTDGRGVRSGGPYHWRTPEEFYNNPEPFKTEIGSMSVPTLQSIEAMMPAKDLLDVNDDWALHDFCKGAQQGDKYIDILNNRYGQITSLNDFARKAQMANYEAFRAMYEGRLAKLFNPVTGIITWMSNPSQNSFVWQIYSHDLEPNASLFGAREACQPIHPMLNQKTGVIMVVNSTSKSKYLELRGELYDSLGQVILTFVQRRTFVASSTTELSTSVKELSPEEDRFLRLTLLTPQTKGHPPKVVATNFYWLGQESSPDNLKYLNSLPIVKLEIHSKVTRIGNNERIVITVKNPSKNIALAAHFQLKQAKTGKRVLPVFYSDNYVSLVPGETKDIEVEASFADFNGSNPLICVDGWNVGAISEKNSGGGVEIKSQFVKPSLSKGKKWPSN